MHRNKTDLERKEKKSLKLKETNKLFHIQRNIHNLKKKKSLFFLFLKKHQNINCETKLKTIIIVPLWLIKNSLGYDSRLDHWRYYIGHLLWGACVPLKRLLLSSCLLHHSKTAQQALIAHCAQVIIWQQKLQEDKKIS